MTALSILENELFFEYDISVTEGIMSCKRAAISGSLASQLTKHKYVSLCLKTHCGSKSFPYACISHTWAGNRNGRADLRYSVQCVWHRRCYQKKKKNQLWTGNHLAQVHSDIKVCFVVTFHQFFHFNTQNSTKKLKHSLWQNPVFTTFC